MLLMKESPLDISLTAPQIGLSLLPIDSALVSVLGIRFHQQIGFKTYPLETGASMDFVGISGQCGWLFT